MWPRFLHKDRQAVTDVPAVYFVKATEENVKRVADDCAHQLYAGLHLNFCGGISKKLMKDFAAQVVVTDTVHLVAKVHEQFLDFVSLEHNLFSFRQAGSFVPCHLPNLTEEQAALHVDRIVTSLFSTVVTLGVAPIIRCPKNGMAEHVARALDERLRAYFMHNSSGSGSRAPFSSFQRPVLVILDRTVDLAVMVQHSWTYQAMVHDIMKSDSNNVSFVQKGDEGETKHSFDLDDERDWFWTENRGKQFAQVAEAVQASMDECKQARKQFDQLRMRDNDEINSVAGKTQGLREFASTLPQLKEKEKTVNMHLKIATKLLEHINGRSLNLFVPVEEAITLGTVDKREVAELLGKDNTEPEDKLRLLLLYLLTKDGLSPNEVEKLEQLVTDCPRADAVHFIKKIMTFTQRRPVQAKQTQSQSTGLLSRLSAVNLGTSNLSDRVFSFVQSGVSNILSTQTTDLYVTRVVDCLMDMKPTMPEVENYLYLDPKIQGLQAGAIPRKTTPYRNAIVFTIGGGNYVEYQNLQNMARKNGKNIIYGSTEILTADHFLQQLDELGRAMKPAAAPPS